MPLFLQRILVADGLFEGVLHLKFFEGLVLTRFDLGGERVERVGRRGEFAVEREEAFCGESASDVEQLGCGAADVKGVAGVGDGYLRLAEFGTEPIDFVAEHESNLVIGRLEEVPGLCAEVLESRGERDRLAFAGLEEFQLLCIDLFAEGVDDDVARVLGIERRKAFEHHSREVNGDEAVKSTAVLKTHVAMEDVEVGTADGLVERPVEGEGQGKPVDGDVMQGLVCHDCFGCSRGPTPAA